MALRDNRDHKLSRRAMLGGGLVASAALLPGCGNFVPRNGVTDAALQRRAVVTGLPGVRVWGDEVPADLESALRLNLGGGAREVRPAFARTPEGRPLVNVLALSGGGQDGAFGGGLLVGWTKRGTRPEFQVVTGVSAGAIIAPFAFLGSKYDKSLIEIWTEYKLADLVVFQAISGLLGASAAIDTAPLAAAIAKYVTPRMLAAIAAEYGRGRLLMIETTNLDAQRPVVWNMGAIAASGHPDALELFRKIVLASAAIPGLFPPVQIQVEVDGKIYEEMHVDGGTTRNVFVSPFPVAYSRFDRFYESPPLWRLYVINNSKITPEHDVIKPQAVSIAARAIATLLKFQGQSELTLIHQRTQASGGDFNLAAVPPDFVPPDVPLADPIYEKALFDLGYNFGLKGGPWMKQPPQAKPQKL